MRREKKEEEEEEDEEESESEEEDNLELTEYEVSKEESEDESLYEEFDLGGLTKEEVREYNKIAPEGQRLQDAIMDDDQGGDVEQGGKADLELHHGSSRNEEHGGSTAQGDEQLDPPCASTQNPSTTNGGDNNCATPGGVSYYGNFHEKLNDDLTYFIEQHPFTLILEFSPFSTSERRAFERDVYDFARSSGISPIDYRTSIRCIRSLHGRPRHGDRRRTEIIINDSAVSEDLDDDSELEGEYNDQEGVAGKLLGIVEGLSASIRRGRGASGPFVQPGSWGPIFRQRLPETLPLIRKTQMRLASTKRLGPEVGIHKCFKAESSGQKRQVWGLKDKNEDKVAPQPNCGEADERKKEKDISKAERKESRRLRRRAKKHQGSGNISASDLPEATTQSTRSLPRFNDAPTITANGAKTDEEGHRNLAELSEHDPNMPEKPGQTNEERQKQRDRIAWIDAQVRRMRDFSNNKQVEMFEHGGMEGIDKRMKKDLEGMKDERDQMREAKARDKDGGRKKKRKRDGTRSGRDRGHGAEPVERYEDFSGKAKRKNDGQERESASSRSLHPSKKSKRGPDANTTVYDPALPGPREQSRDAIGDPGFPQPMMQQA